MQRRGKALSVPKGRRYVRVTCLDEQGHEEKLEELAARQDDLEVRLSIQKDDLTDELKAEMRQQLADIVGEKKAADRLEVAVHFKRRFNATEAAAIQWVVDSREKLAAILRSEGRDNASVEEMKTYAVLPYCAVIGVMWWHPEVELEAKSPADDDWDFENYSERIFFELIDGVEDDDGNVEHSFSDQMIYSLGVQLVDKVAGVYTGLRRSQETRDFLQVRKAPTSGQPSESE